MMQDEVPDVLSPAMETSSEYAAYSYDALGDDFAEPADLPDDEALKISTRWALSTGDATTGLQLLQGAATRYIYNAARDTLSQAANAEDGARWGRSLGSAKPCEFCIMLAGRGAVYTSADTAGEAMTYHDDCDCEVYVERS